MAVPFTDATSDMEILSARQSGAEIAELRVDLFRDPSPESVATQLLRCDAFRFRIVTVRSKSEGGEWAGSEDARFLCYRSALAEGAGVDVELSSGETRQRVFETAASTEALTGPIILSYHDFHGTPSFDQLQQKVDAMFHSRADIAKIATLARTVEDVRVLASLLTQNTQRPLVVIGMGPMSALCRIFFPALGSLWTFAHAGNPTAPGQMPVLDTIELLRRFYPQTRSRIADPNESLTSKG